MPHFLETGGEIVFPVRAAVGGRLPRHRHLLAEGVEKGGEDFADRVIPVGDRFVGNAEKRRRLGVSGNEVVNPLDLE